MAIREMTIKEMAIREMAIREIAIKEIAIKEMALACWRLGGPRGQRSQCRTAQHAVPNTVPNTAAPTTTREEEMRAAVGAAAR